MLNLGTTIPKRIGGPPLARSFGLHKNQGVLVTPARDTVRFGAENPDLRLALAKILEPLELGSLMKTKYEKDFKDVTLYNGPNAQLLPVLPALDKADFIARLEKSSHPVETAEIIATLSKTLKLQSAAGRAVLSKLAATLSLETLQRFSGIAQSLKEIGFLYESRNDWRVACLLNRMLHLYLDGGISLSDMESLKDVLPKLLPAKNDPLSDGEDESAEEALEARASSVFLLESVMARYPHDISQADRITFSEKPFIQTVREVFGEIYRPTAGMFEELADPVCVSANLISLMPTLENFQDMSRQFREMMDSPGFTEPFKTAVFTMCQSLRNPFTIEAAITLAYQYEKLGGDPLFLARFLAEKRYGLRTITPQTLHEQFDGILTAILPFTTPESRRAYESVWDVVWEKRPNALSYPQWIARLTRIRMALPACLPEYRRDTILKEKITDPARVDGVEKKLKALFSGFETDPVGAEILSLALINTAGEGFGRARMTQQLLLGLRPFVQAALSTITLSNKVQPYKVTDLANTLRVLTRVSTISSTASLGKLPMKVWEKAIQGICTTLANEAKRRPPNPKQFDFTTTETAVGKTLEFLEEGLIPGSKAGEVCAMLMDISPSMGPLIFQQFCASLKFYFSKRLTTPEQRLAALHTFQETVGDFRRRNIPFGPLYYLFSRRLSLELPEKWPAYLEGFAEAINGLTDGEREPLNASIMSLPGDCIASIMKGVSAGTCQGPVAPYISTVFEILRTSPEIFKKRQYHEPFRLIAANTRSLADFKTTVHQFLTMGNQGLSVAERLQSLDSFLEAQRLPQRLHGTEPEKIHELKARAHTYLAEHPTSEHFVPFLLHLLLDPHTRNIPLERLTQILETALQENPGVPEEKTLLGQFLGMKAQLISVAFHQPEYFSVLMEMLCRLPGKWTETASLLNNSSVFMLNKLNLAETLDSEMRQKIFRDNFQLIALMRHPNLMLNYFMLNRDRIHPETVQYLYQYLDNGIVQYGWDLLPEALAMVRPFLAMFSGDASPEKQREEKRRIAMNKASEGVTRLYSYLTNSPEAREVRSIKGIALNNWTGIATLGLSFTKWQYDSMTRWKGQGPSEKPPLMVQSGLFKPLPPRDNDKTYHGGFYHYDPATGVSIEMRRACLVISKPGLGSLVIRNSSPVFGRDLLKEPAYYHPDKTFSHPPELFNPDALEEYESVLGKKLNQTNVQETNHQKIKALLGEFEKVMERYTDWKCGFKNGRAPEGFREILRASLASAQNDGAITPFGKKKNIKLAWVNPYELPFAVSSFDVTKPEHQREIGRFLNILDKRTTVQNGFEYETTLPQLLAFLKDGLEKNLELVLTEG